MRKMNKHIKSEKANRAKLLSGCEKEKRIYRLPGLIAVAAIIGAAAFGGTSAVMALSSAGNAGGFSLAGLLSSYRMFYGAGELAGGRGTTYSGNIIDASAAVVDSDASAGYLTDGDDSFYDVKYAVVLYGINHDTYLDDSGDEQTAGLTFGPATGADYTDSYAAHLTEEEFLSGEKGVCLHWMTWEEIIIQSEIDPTVFEECLEDGCTHAVNLVLNDAIIGSSCSGQMDGGDGASVLSESIAEEYQMWNSSYDTDEMSDIWNESRMRATLNGTSSDTNSVYAGTDTLSTEECLFSCFPRVLQDAVVAKKVDYNTYRTSKDEADMRTSYDCLWLFSYKEMLDYTNVFNLKYEGTQYARNADIVSQGNSGLSPNGYLPFVGYNESGAENTWWLRTGDTGYSYSVYRMTERGSAGINVVTTVYGLAPGFCLP